jgi:hypothetical protein
MKKLAKKPIAVVKPQEFVRREISQIIDTSGGEMPDPDQHQGTSGNAVRHAFKNGGKKMEPAKHK